MSCYQNQLTELDISENLALTHISCSQNSITQLDVSNNINLEYLNCYGNNLTSLDVSQNTNLLYLSCLANQLTSLDLSNNSQLTEIYCYQNQLELLNIMNGNNNNITNFIATGNSNLTCIQVDDYLSANTNSGIYSSWSIDSTVTYANGDCTAQTYVPDTNFEQALADLGYDRVINDYVPTVNISGYINTLDISNKNINDLTGIQNFVGVAYLYCQNNQLTSINLGENEGLHTLVAYNNSLSNLVLPNATGNFRQLSIYNNLLTNLNVNNYPFLSFLNFSENNMSSIDISNLSYLNTFYGHNNILTSLDISNNTSLVNFRCNDNNLLSLNAQNGNNATISDFRSENNPNLTCIFVDDAEWSETNWTNVDATSTFVETEGECNSLSTDDDILKKSISIYPNPTTGIVTINYLENLNIKELSLTNTLGQEILKTNEISTILDISEVSNGIYYLNIKNDKNQNAIFKIIKN